MEEGGFIQMVIPAIPIVKAEDIKKNAQSQPDEAKKQLILINKDSCLDSNLFLDQEITDFRCIICENVPNPEVAYEAKCCGILFCKECLMKWIGEKPKCPICKKTLKQSGEYIRSIKDDNKIFYKMLQKFIIKCPYGCNWNGEWDTLEEHLGACEKGVRECKYKHIGCEYIDEKTKMLEHEEKNDKLHLELAIKFIKDNQRIEEEKEEDN